MSILLASLIVQVAAEARRADPAPLEPLGRFDARAIPEASGIVKSRRHPGIFWVHNDSGNAPLLFAVRSDGRIVRRFRLGVPNLDWEDIAIDDQGHLYLGDIGNNARPAAAPGDLSDRRARPVVPEDEDRDRPLAATRTVSYVLPASEPVRRGEPGLRPGDRDPGRQVPRRSRGRAVRRAARSAAAPVRAPARPRSIGKLPRLHRARHGRRPERRTARYWRSARTR